jgi:hypothetical protein
MVWFLIYMLYIYIMTGRTSRAMTGHSRRSMTGRTSHGDCRFAMTGGTSYGDVLPAFVSAGYGGDHPMLCAHDWNALSTFISAFCLVVSNQLQPSVLYEVFSPARDSVFVHVKFVSDPQTGCPTFSGFPLQSPVIEPQLECQRWEKVHVFPFTAYE